MSSLRARSSVCDSEKLCDATIWIERTPHSRHFTGAEEAVLRTVNFRTVAVRVLVVERPTVAVRALLRDAGMAAVAEYSSALGDVMFARNDLLAALSDDERARRLAVVRRLATPFDAARAH